MKVIRKSVVLGIDATSTIRVTYGISLLVQSNMGGAGNRRQFIVYDADGSIGLLLNYLPLYVNYADSDFFDCNFDIGTIQGHASQSIITPVRTVNC